MKLLVDAGNSRIKWGWIAAGKMGNHDAVPYTPGRLAKALDPSWGTLEIPEQVWVANVAGPIVQDQLIEWCERRWNRQPQFARVTQTCKGVSNAYTDVSRLGIDRWLALVAARTKYSRPVLIAGCGTALTIDVMDQDGHHMGGLIVPGTKLMRTALYEKIPVIPGSTISPSGAGALADNTDLAVANGCVLAIAALIERVMCDVQQNTALADVCCILTGGDAEQIAMMINLQHEIHPHLVLEGLALYAGVEI